MIDCICLLNHFTFIRLTKNTNRSETLSCEIQRFFISLKFYCESVYSREKFAIILMASKYKIFESLDIYDLYTIFSAIAIRPLTHEIIFALLFYY